MQAIIYVRYLSTFILQEHRTACEKEQHDDTPVRSVE
jgi:hypothetical protein